jgi:hypothetical protein
MFKIPSWLLLVLVCFASSCAFQHSYFLSPLDINSHPYQNIPPHRDSTKSAFYAAMSFGEGISNYMSRDHLFLFNGNIHRGQNFGHFQAYYGAGLSLGNYHVSNYSLGYVIGNPIRDTTINYNTASDQSFGAIGVNGGINYVIPLPRGGEWRAIGIETSLQKEFGSYLNFRKSMVDSNFDILATYSLTKTIGLSTEFIWVRKSGTELGYKMALGGTIVNSNNYLGDNRGDVPMYFSHTFHMTKGNITGYCQINFGDHTDSFQFGVNYRLGRINPD